MGCFGAPAEEYAIKNHIHPKEAVKKNIETFKQQMKTLGFSFDWDREFSTTDPEYYKWTQWQFLQFYKHNMAYKATIPVNWCPKCKTVLSNHTYSTAATPQHPENLNISNLFLRRIEDRMTSGEVIGAKTGFVNQSGNSAVSYEKAASGKTYICVTAGASSGWHCIDNHVYLYNTYGK